jgi:hypothetical protein
MEPLDFFTGPSHLPLAFQKIVPCHLDLEKYPKITLVFNVRDEFSYENKLY